LGFDSFDDLEDDEFLEGWSGIYVFEFLGPDEFAVVKVSGV
jgi:hypothetical protein